MRCNQQWFKIGFIFVLFFIDTGVSVLATEAGRKCLLSNQPKLMKFLEFCSGGTRSLSAELAGQAEELNILILGETGAFALNVPFCQFLLLFLVI